MELSLKLSDVESKEMFKTNAISLEIRPGEF